MEDTLGRRNWTKADLPHGAVCQARLSFPVCVPVLGAFSITASVLGVSVPRITPDVEERMLQFRQHEYHGVVRQSLCSSPRQLFFRDSPRIERSKSISIRSAPSPIFSFFGCGHFIAVEIGVRPTATKTRRRILSLESDLDAARAKGCCSCILLCFRASADNVPGLERLRERHAGTGND